MEITRCKVIILGELEPTSLNTIYVFCVILAQVILHYQREEQLFSYSRARGVF